MTIEQVRELLGITDNDSESDDLDEMVHEHFASLASAVNNDGIEAQIQCLLDAGWSRSDFQSFLEQMHQ